MSARIARWQTLNDDIGRYSVSRAGHASEGGDFLIIINIHGLAEIGNTLILA